MARLRGALVGVPGAGLEAFGADEDVRLAEVARDPAFREAVGWQSRESLVRAVDKLAAGAPGSPSRQRRWVDVAGSYWQRYCSKNDTIGFFGPLAWGSFAEDGDALAVRSGALEGERVVHFETWAMEAVARLPAADGPVPRARRARADTPGLERMEAARDAVAAARREDVPPRSTGSTACSRRSPGVPRRAPTVTPAAGARSPIWTACATST